MKKITQEQLLNTVKEVYVFWKQNPHLIVFLLYALFLLITEMFLSYIFKISIFIKVVIEIEHLTGRGSFETAEDMEESGLTGTALTHDDVDTFVELKISILDSLDISLRESL